MKIVSLDVDEVLRENKDKDRTQAKLERNKWKIYKKIIEVISEIYYLIYKLSY